jgi:hypothetical protein
LVLFGCGSNKVPAPADAEEGRAALLAALGSWQKGDKPEALQQRRPPIVVNDPARIAGERLVRFQLLEGHEYHGTQLQCRVKLTFQDQEEGLKERTVTYLIDTHPALVVVRGDM